MNESHKKPLPGWLPFAIGALFVLLFSALGGWQVSRGLEKRADQAAFDAETGFAAWQDGMEIRPYQRIKATGRYDGDRQFLLENITRNGRPGYYLLTPLVALEGEPVLLVNRGWLADPGTADLSVPDARITVRGRAGHLPRAAFRMGDAVAASASWPRRAVFPTTGDVAAALGQDVQDFVLLMDAEEAGGFVREWSPAGFGPGKHFGYALQWFAMAVVLSGLLIWNYRKKRFDA